MAKKSLVNSNNRTDNFFLAQPKINLQNFHSTPDSLSLRLKAFERKRSLGASEIYGAIFQYVFRMERNI